MTLSKNVSSQNANLIIQVNEKLITKPLYCSLTFDSTNGQRFNVWYMLGELMLDTLIWNKINKDSTKSFWLHFYGIDKYNTTPYFAELTARHLRKSFLILNVYDFSEKKYKRWY